MNDRIKNIIIIIGISWTILGLIGEKMFGQIGLYIGGGFGGFITAIITIRHNNKARQRVKGG